jgi:CDP-diacylglycerol--glycerol-3-phosphate 3-phosphatidyltransferase
MAKLAQTKEWLKHMPNKLTVSRMAVIPLLLALYPISKKLWLFCAILFAFAAITDYLDGWLARRYGNVTPLGALLDPIADKMLVAGSLVLLSSSGVVPAFLTGLIICRDVGVSGLRLMAMEQHFKIEVNDFGKWKTALLSISIFSLFAYEPIFGLPLREIGMVSMWISLVLSLYSAWLYGRAYLAEAKSFFGSEEQP